MLNRFRPHDLHILDFGLSLWSNCRSNNHLGFFKVWWIRGFWSNSYNWVRKKNRIRLGTNLVIYCLVFSPRNKFFFPPFVREFCSLTAKEVKIFADFIKTKNSSFVSIRKQTYFEEGYKTFFSLRFHPTKNVPNHYLEHLLFMLKSSG